MIDAEAMLAQEEERNAGAVELALYAAPAVFVEPALLRALRLALLPQHGADVECDLWFGGLVAARSIHGIAFELPAVALLRRRLRDRYAQRETRARVERAWKLIQRHHEAIAPALQLEERIAWLAVQGEPPEKAEYELHRALTALATGERPSLADWAERAWRRMPEEVRQTRAAWQLRQAAAHVRRQRLALVPSTGSPFDLGAALATLEPVRLGVRRLGDAIEIGHVQGDAAILVPDTDPRLVEVSQQGADEPPQTIQFPPQGRGTAKVTLAAVRLRTAAGVVFELPAVDAAPEEADFAEARAALRFACVRVLGGDALSVGFFVAPDLVVAGSMPDARRVAWSSREVAVVSWRGREFEADVELADEVLAVLRLRNPVSDAQPIDVPASGEPPSSGEPWVSSAFGEDKPLVLHGHVRAFGSFHLSGRPISLQLVLDVPQLGPTDWISLYGAPVLTAGGLAGVVTGVLGSRVDGSEDTLGAVSTAVVRDLLARAEARGEIPRTRALADVLQSIALAFHVGLRSLVDEDRGLYQIAGEEAGLTREQFDAVKGAAEWLVREVVDEVVSDSRVEVHEQLEPRGERAASLGDRARVVVDAIVRELGSRKEPIQRRFYRHDAPRLLERELRDAGLELALEPDIMRVAGPPGAFVRATERLGDELQKGLRAYDEWPAAAPGPPPNVDGRRVAAIVDFVRDVGQSVALSPELSDALADISRAVTPPWWSSRDRLVAVGLRDVSPTMDAAAFLDAYLRHVYRILSVIGRPFGDRSFSNGFAIQRPSYALLRREGRLEPLEQVGVSTNGVLLGGPYSAFATLFEWAGSELVQSLPGGPRAPVSA